MTNQDPKLRRYSSDPYFRLDPEVLAQASKSDAPPPILAGAIVEAQEGPRGGPHDEETLVPCAECESCGGCGGKHMVSAATRAAQLTGRLHP